MQISLFHELRSQDPTAKIATVKAAQKFFSEDKDRSFEAKVYIPMF
jgi:hypothetical protein